MQLRITDHSSHAFRQTVGRALQSLKLRVTVVVVVSLAVGIGSITTALVNRAERDTLQAQHQLELSDVSRTASRVSSNVLALQHDLQSAAAQITPTMLADVRLLDAFLKSKTTLRSRFDSVYVADEHGRVLAIFDSAGVRHPVLDVADRDYFRQTVARQATVVSNPINSRLSGEPVVVVSYPVLQPGGVVAVLAGALKLSSRDLLADTVSTEQPNGEALMVLANDDGTLLAHPDRTRVKRSLADEPRLSRAFSDWVAKGSPLEPLGLALTQPGEVVSAAGIAGTDWMVWRVRSEADLLMPLRAARRQAIGWAAGLIAAVSAVTFLFIWHALRPLAQLERRAQHLFARQMDDAAAEWPEGGGEIGRLGRVLRHVSAERAQLEAFNTQVLRKLGLVMSAAPIGIAFTRNKRYELVSAEFCRLLGHDENQLLGKPARTIYLSDEQHAELGDAVREAFAANRAYAGEWQLRRADGGLFWASVRANPVEAGDRSAGTIWSFADISDQRTQNEQLAWLASHDPLTGLANRKLFEQRASAVVAALPHSVPASIVFIDLDRFKPINDNFGHAAGDAMLRAVAHAIGSAVRASDLIVRLGGDEFALLLERCGQDAAMRVAEGVRQAIDAIALDWQGQTLRVGASLGIGCLSHEMTSAADWLAAADSACYAAKSAGRGVVRVNGHLALVRTDAGAVAMN